MGALRESQICPKRERCKHGDECMHQDTFRGECLCFERKRSDFYETQMEINRKAMEKRKKGRRTKR